jgi:hypothetical protein
MGRGRSFFEIDPRESGLKSVLLGLFLQINAVFEDQSLIAGGFLLHSRCGKGMGWSCTWMWMGQRRLWRQARRVSAGKN